MTDDKPLDELEQLMRACAGPSPEFAMESALQDGADAIRDLRAEVERLRDLLVAIDIRVRTMVTVGEQVLRHHRRAVDGGMEGEQRLSHPRQNDDRER